MKRITQEESKQFIPCSEDYANNPPAYFTSTIDKDGWDNIVYYTDKKRGLFFGREGDEWVYILTNPAIPEMVKIGYTKMDPHTRALQISKGTGIPLGYEVAWAYKCYKGERIEREVHNRFKKQRVSPTREFFRVTLEEAKQIIEQIGKKYV